METRLLWLEMAALGLGLGLIQLGVLAVELQTAIVMDWFVTLAPIVWVLAGALAVYGLLRLLGGPAPPGKPEGLQGEVRGNPLVTPVLSGLLPVLRDRKFQMTWIAAAGGYAAAFMLLQGILVIDLAATLTPGVTFLPSPVGYGPGIVWTPSPTVGLALRPYTMAAVISLSLYSGLVLALVPRLLARNRQVAPALPLPLVGLGVVCPACLASPASGLVVAYLAPAALWAGLGGLSLFSLTLGLATLLFLLSLVLLGLTLRGLSRLLAAPTPQPSEPATS